MLQTLIYELIILLLILFFIYIIFKNIFTTREYLNIGKSISKGFKNTISNPVSSGTKTAINTVSNTATGTTNTAVNAVSNTATKVIDTSKDFGANMTDGAYDLGNEIQEVGQQIQGILGDALSSLLSSVYALNNTFNAISSNLQSITS